MRVRVNGKDRDLPDSVNLREYVASLGVNMAAIAVAVNGEVVKRDSLASVELAEGDTVEVVRAVGGG
jgi:sulfur carrier protein